MCRSQIVTPREIEDGEPPSKFDSFSIPSLCRLFRCIKKSQVDFDVVMNDSRSPLSSFRKKIYSNKTAGVVSLAEFIVLALTWVGNSQIRPSVVERVVVDVIDNLIGECVHHSAVHQQCVFFPVLVDNTNRIVTLYVFAPHCAPMMLVKFFVVAGIDTGNLPLSQWNVPSCRIVGLDDGGSCVATIPTKFGSGMFQVPALGTGVILAAIFKVRSNNQLTLVHFSPPRETCGLAALLAF